MKPASSAMLRLPIPIAQLRRPAAREYHVQPSIPEPLDQAFHPLAVMRPRRRSAPSLQGTKNWALRFLTRLNQLALSQYAGHVFAVGLSFIHFAMH